MGRNSEQLGNSAPEQADEEDAKNFEQQLGSRVLASVGFEQRHKDIVESSFNKARARGERLSGKNSERRDLAYIERLDGMVERYGNDMERRLWRASAKKLIIVPEDIQESYWRSQEQILRDDGQGNRRLSMYEKEQLTDDIIKRQAKSLEPWANYLSDQNSPYPLWFKLYAWDGMSRMGVFDKEKGKFDTRNKHTVAPYPKLNPAVLAKTYRNVLDAYGIESRVSTNLDGSLLVKTDGKKVLSKPSRKVDFNETYSKLLLSEKKTLKTPERTEDIHGQWIEYLPGDEDALANAAEGTPWCIADPGTAREYLSYGEDDGYAGMDDNQAKFLLFHLQDETTGAVMDNGCASIRLNAYGEVDEISGLGEGQALEDSLVPIVEEKVLTLSGGERFLEGFADKRMLIALDHKMQNNETLMRSEMEFLYEIDRFIVTLDTYNDVDPRIEELQDFYTESAREQGILTDEHEQFLLDVRSDGYCKPEYFAEHFENGEKISMLLQSTKDRQLSGENAALALSAKEVDSSLLIKKLSEDEVAKHISFFMSEMNIDEIVPNLPSDYLSGHVPALLQEKASLDLLIPRLSQKSLAKNFNKLVEVGAKAENIVPYLNDVTVAKSARFLVEHHGVNQSVIVKALPSEMIQKNFNYLRQKQGIDINLLVPKLKVSIIQKNIKFLAENGTSGEVIFSALESSPLTILDSFDDLVSIGVKPDLNKISERLSPTDMIYRLNTLDRLGIKYDVNEIAEGAEASDVEEFQNDLLERGVSEEIIIRKIGYIQTED